MGAPTEHRSSLRTTTRSAVAQNRAPCGRSLWMPATGFTLLALVSALLVHTDADSRPAAACRGLTGLVFYGHSSSVPRHYGRLTETRGGGGLSLLPLAENAGRPMSAVMQLAFAGGKLKSDDDEPAATISSEPPPRTPQPVRFFSGLTDWAVLQRAPDAANVFGMLGEGGTAAKVTVSSETGTESMYEVAAVTDGHAWKATLKPTPSGGGDVTITVTCTGCTNQTAAVLRHVSFGDVYYCAGQSNMWLPLGNTLTRNATVSALAKGEYRNIRLVAGDSQIQAQTCGWAYSHDSSQTLGSSASTDHTSKCGWQTAAAAATDGLCSGVTQLQANGTSVGTCSLERFSAACYCECLGYTHVSEAAAVVLEFDSKR
jgi:hypothetical protein|eukprot:COSAG02_NODE_508_length_20916_cov_162.483691_13_plen_372_part_00